MSTDRELLELAAKTLGGEYIDHALGGQYLAFLPNWNGIRWNPLTDDGDCARLEAALSINVTWCGNYVLVDQNECDIEFSENYSSHSDKQAARRIASLRIAAEIGRAMT